MEEIDFANTESIVNGISKLIDNVNVRTRRVPEEVILAANARSGLSRTRVFNNILRDLQNKNIVLTLEDGTEAPIVSVVDSIVSEIIKELHERARIDLTIPLGIPVTAAGAVNPSGTVTVVGATTDIARKGVGLIV